MKIQQGNFCPFIKEDCVQMKCALFTCLRGINPNTGEDIDEWGCAVGWLPSLLINTANEARKNSAATESFRNEMVNQGQQNQQVLLAAAQLANGSLILEGKK